MTSLPSAESIGAIVVAVFGSIGGAWALRRRMSKDSLETQKNKEEGGWITRIQKERDSALERERATWNLHLQDVETIASYRMKTTFLLEKVERMERQIQLIKRLLMEEKPEFKGLLDTDFGDLSNR